MEAPKEIPEKLRTLEVTDSTIELTWFLKRVKDKEVTYQISIKKSGGFFINWNPETLYETQDTSYTINNLDNWTSYDICMRCGYDNSWGKWSDKLTVRTTMPFSWKATSDENNSTKHKRYSVNERNPQIVTTISDYWRSTIVGTTSLPPNRIVTWNIRVLRSRGNNGFGVYVGIAPFDIAQDDDDIYMKCGWFIDCFESTLWSGPPHNYRGKTYGPWKENGDYVHSGDVVGVTVDMLKGEVAFAINGADLDVAFKGISLDKSIVPCVLMKWKGDSIEFCDYRILTENDRNLLKRNGNNNVINNNNNVNNDDDDDDDDDDGGGGNNEMEGNGSNGMSKCTNTPDINCGISVMKEALLEAELTEEEADRICIECYEKARKVSKEGNLFPGFTVDDAAAIAMYTFVFPEEELHYYNPYSIVNKTLRGNSDVSGDVIGSGLVRLVLTSLRKLPRVGGISLYRGARCEVDRDVYVVGNDVTWDSMTSTSQDMNVTRKFLGTDPITGKSAGVLFMIENAWGYDIEKYSLYPDDCEIVLEPKWTFKIVNVVIPPVDKLSIVNLEAVDTPVMLPEVFGCGKE